MHLSADGPPGPHSLCHPTHLWGPNGVQLAAGCATGAVVGPSAFISSEGMSTASHRFFCCGSSHDCALLIEICPNQCQQSLQRVLALYFLCRLNTFHSQKLRECLNTCVPKILKPALILDCWRSALPLCALPSLWFCTRALPPHID